MKFTADWQEEASAMEKLEKLAPTEFWLPSDPQAAKFLLNLFAELARFEIVPVAVPNLAYLWDLYATSSSASARIRGFAIHSNLDMLLYEEKNNSCFNSFEALWVPPSRIDFCASGVDESPRLIAHLTSPPDLYPWRKKKKST